ncbi:TPA: YeiH family protein [Streptococcus suis]
MENQIAKRRPPSIIMGLGLALLLALVAKIIEGLLPGHWVGASVLAMFMGMIIHYFWHPSPLYQPGLNFASKKVLRLAIILLGSTLDLRTVFLVGQQSVWVMLFTFLTCFGGGYWIGKALGLNWRLSNLISAGTGICGGSAIAAIAPVIDAKDDEVAYAMSSTFLFDVAMIVLFPIMGRLLGMSDWAYGMWAGTAVNDTSSVVAASYAFSDLAGDFATMVKLTRTMAIIPTVIVFSMIAADVKEGPRTNVYRYHMGRTIPWFIIGFLAMTVIKSIGLIPVQVGETIKDLSKFMMVIALAAIGLKTNLKSMKAAGIGPLLHGFLISSLVVIVAYMVIAWMGV